MAVGGIGVIVVVLGIVKVVNEILLDRCAGSDTVPEAAADVTLKFDVPFAVEDAAAGLAEVVVVVDVAPDVVKVILKSCHQSLNSSGTGLLASLMIFQASSGFMLWG